MTAAALLLAASALASAPAAPAAPSGDAPEPGCVWKRLSAAKIGVELRYQKCDFGWRQITFKASVKKATVFRVTHDPKKKKDSFDAVVAIFDKPADEKLEDAVRRVGLAGQSWSKKRHCEARPRKLAFIGRGKSAWVLQPDEDYAAHLKRQAGDDIPEPPCGEMGDLPDGLSYFEFHDDEPRRFAFVFYGQDEHPLFDPASLKFITREGEPTAAAAPASPR